MDGIDILIPGGLRLRSVRALADRDGSCPLLYDFERSRLVDVPHEFQLHLQAALETGDLDEDLLAWLASEDVLTYERQAGWPAGEPAPWSETAEAPEPARLTGSTASFGEVYFVRDRIHCRIDLDREDDALATLDALLRQADGAPRFSLELASGEPVRRFEPLRRIVDEAGRHGRLTAREITYDVTVAAEAIDRRRACFLADHPFEVRICRAAGRAPSRSWKRGLDLLLRDLPDRVTVRAALGAGERLATLWEWAKESGVLHLDAVKTDEGADAFGASRTGLRAGELRWFRQDLFDVCDEMFAALELGRVPPLYEPVARAVRRLFAGRPVTPGDGAEGTCVGLVSNGQVLPFCGGPGVGPAIDSAGDGSWMDCADCSEFRRTEVEAAILFYGRLRQADSALLLGFPTEGPEVVFDPLPAPPQVELKTC